MTIIEALDALSKTETPSGSVAEAIEKLTGLVISDGAAAVAAALESDGAITAAITAAIEAAVAEGGAVETYVLGVLPKAAAQADSTATTAEGLVTEFNALLAKLRAAGLMAASE